MCTTFKFLYLCSAYSPIYVYTKQIYRYVIIHCIFGDPDHPEYDGMLQWAEKDTGGRKFDPEYFYIHELNRKLAITQLKCY